jgi:hypothetical protein
VSVNGNGRLEQRDLHPDPGIGGATQDDTYVYLTGVAPGSYTVTATGLGNPAPPAPSPAPATSRRLHPLRGRGRASAPSAAPGWWPTAPGPTPTRRRPPAPPAPTPRSTATRREPGQVLLRRRRSAAQPGYTVCAAENGTCAVHRLRPQHRLRRQRRLRPPGHQRLHRLHQRPLRRSHRRQSPSPATCRRRRSPGRRLDQVRVPERHLLGRRGQPVRTAPSARSPTRRPPATPRAPTPRSATRSPASRRACYTEELLPHLLKSAGTAHPAAEGALTRTVWAPGHGDPLGPGAGRWDQLLGTVSWNVVPAPRYAVTLAATCAGVRTWSLTCRT